MPKMPQKYEREIDEILRRFDDWPPRRPRRRRAMSIGAWRSRLPSVHLRMSPTMLFVACIALALLGYLIRPIVPSLAMPLSLLGLAAFIGALVLSLTRSRSQRPSMWRGRPLQLTGPTWLDSLRGRWHSWRRRRHH